jgi:hypothetical protein
MILRAIVDLGLGILERRLSALKGVSMTLNCSHRSY